MKRSYVTKGVFGRADAPSSQRSRDAAAGLQQPACNPLAGADCLVALRQLAVEEEKRRRNASGGGENEEKRPRNLGGIAQEDPQGMAGVQISEEDWLRRNGVISEEERWGISRRSRSSCELRRRKMDGRWSSWPAARGGGGAAQVGKKRKTKETRERRCTRKTPDSGVSGMQAVARFLQLRCSVRVQAKARAGNQTGPFLQLGCGPRPMRETKHALSVSFVIGRLSMS